MRLLLDTHTTVWAVEDNPRLSARCREMIENPANDLVASLASVWEMSIKGGLRKLELKAGVAGTVAALVRHGVRLLPIDLAHVLAVQNLPPHHGDPFDRLLIVQSRIENLTLASRDEVFDAYGVERV